MALGFAVLDPAAPELDGSRSALGRTEPLTLGTGLFGAQRGGLLLQEFLDGSLGHRTGRVLGDLLDLVGNEVELETDPLVDAAHHDFSPSLGHETDASRIHRRRLMGSHGESLFGLRERSELRNLG